MKFNFKISAIAAILASIFLLLVVSSFVVGMIFGEIQVIKYLELVFSILFIISASLVFLGYHYIAKELEIRFLKIMSILGIIITLIPLTYLYNFFMLPATDFSITSFFIYIPLSGIIFLLFGIAVFKLKEHFGERLQNIRLFYILAGIPLVFMIFVPIFPFLRITLFIFEAKLFFDISKKTDIKPLPKKKVTKKKFELKELFKEDITLSTWPVTKSVLKWSSIIFIVLALLNLLSYLIIAFDINWMGISFLITLLVVPILTLIIVFYFALKFNIERFKLHTLGLRAEYLARLALLFFIYDIGLAYIVFHELKWPDYGIVAILVLVLVPLFVTKGFKKKKVKD